MGSAKSNPEFTFEAYLNQEEGAEFKSEFYQGEVFAMSGGTWVHSKLSANMARALGNELEDQNCSVFDASLLVRVERANAAFYPDCMVVCGDLDFFESKSNVILNPVLIVEVLSKSTAAYDRGGKFQSYGLISSLQEYVLIDQTKMLVEVFRRTEDGLWTLERFEGRDSFVRLRSIGVTISNQKIYAKTPFTLDEV